MRNVLVPFDGSENAEAALQLACTVVDSQGRVVLLGITVVHRALRLADLPAHFDEPALRALHHAWALTEPYDIAVEPRLRRTHDMAKTILHEAQAGEIDAIFLGLKPTRFPWLYPGINGTTRAVLRDAPCPVLVGRFSPPVLCASTPRCLSGSEYHPFSAGHRHAAGHHEDLVGNEASVR